RGVPRPPAVILLAPGERVVFARPAALKARQGRMRPAVEALEDAGRCPRVLLEEVPFVLDDPLVAEVARGRMGAVLHDHPGRLGPRGMAREVRAHQSAVERPAVLRIAGRVNADEAAPAPDEPLHRGLLRRAE